MSTEFKLRPQADYVHVELAPGYEIKPDGASALTHAISEACVAQNRGARVEFFTDREAALRWLGV